jgi:thiosulfate sulfurtransferase
MNPFVRLSVPEAKNLLRENDCLLLDCRDAGSYQAGHIDNALHLDNDVVKSLVADGDKDKPVVIYCYHGNSSQQVAGMFAGFGFRQVYSVDGGFESWKTQL